MAEESLESLLVDFYIAIENVDLKQAHKALQRMKKPLEKTQNATLLNTLENIELSLEQNTPPDPEAINVLTVLLGETA